MKDALAQQLKHATLGWFIANYSIEGLFDQVLTEEQRNKLTEDMVDECINLPGTFGHKIDTYATQWARSKHAETGDSVLTVENLIIADSAA